MCLNNATGKTLIELHTSRGMIHTIWRRIFQTFEINVWEKNEWRLNLSRHLLIPNLHTHKLYLLARPQGVKICQNRTLFVWMVSWQTSWYATKMCGENFKFLMCQKILLMCEKKFLAIKFYLLIIFFNYLPSSRSNPEKKSLSKRIKFLYK